MADLLQREAEPTRLGDKVQDAQDLGVIYAIARRRPPGFAHDATRFIETQRSAGDSGTRGEFSDRQGSLGH